VKDKAWQHDWMTKRQELAREWYGLVLKYAPQSPSSSSIWRYSAPLSREHPDQGWKIHVSGTPLNASQILRSMLPILTGGDIVFKVPHSLDELMKINSGIYYGYSQIGKFVTVYPKKASEFRSLARRLHQATANFEAPQIPFDFHFSDRSCVYFRYGRFKSNQLTAGEISNVSMLTAPDGTKVLDDRFLASYVPGWSAKPVNTGKNENARKILEDPFGKRYCVFRSIVQRGKGGIYEAMDMKRGEKVIIKEGRAKGEVDWDGRDGIDRLRNEMTALSRLRHARVPVPEIFANFENEGNSYLVLEKINGVTLRALIEECFSRLTVDESLRLGLKTAVVVSRIHEAGWVWRDCKPANLLITPTGRVRPIDFEGACRVDHPSTVPWSSKGFASPETRTSDNRDSNLPEDLYALGATLHFLLTGFLPEQTNHGGKPITHNHIPKHLAKTIMGLLEPNPKRRPNAATVILQLSSCLN